MHSGCSEVLLRRTEIAYHFRSVSVADIATDRATAYGKQSVYSTQFAMSPGIRPINPQVQMYIADTNVVTFILSIMLSY